LNLKNKYKTKQKTEKRKENEKRKQKRENKNKKEKSLPGLVPHPRTGCALASSHRSSWCIGLAMLNGSTCLDFLQVPESLGWPTSFHSSLHLFEHQQNNSLSRGEK
jgi:hypothetical protein